MTVGRFANEVSLQIIIALISISGAGAARADGSSTN